ncbi:hypothetical protein [uncultured Jatrophihabitans sp.]|uniref:hypothetical protein n=1 Tax=uncultured Jatrophihabitans sp. TaxID=1610747 RepID=UPI0035CB3763
MSDSAQSPASTEGRPHTRRWFLAGAAALVLGGGGGAAAQLLHHPRRAARPAPPPASLVSALAAEDALIRDLDATTGGGTAVRLVIAQVRADHVAHAAALRGLIATYPRATAGGSASASPTPSGTARTREQLRAAETAASGAAASRAAQTHGEVAALLASVAACEATHAELLA